MRRALVGAFWLMLAPVAAVAGSDLASLPGLAGLADLSPQARAHLSCVVSSPSREGPEPCGAGAHPESCAGLPCLRRHLDGWRELLAVLAGAAPEDWQAQLAADDAVPSHVGMGMVAATTQAWAEIGADCAGPDAGREALEGCVFQAANLASSWLDIHQWLNGQDPRLRGVND